MKNKIIQEIFSNNLENTKKQQTHPFCGKKNCECTFASIPTSSLWHPTKNGTITPGDLAKTKSNTKYFFLCNVCDHAFEKTIFDMSYGRTACLQCSKRDWKHCKKDDCDYCFNRSFASHEKSAYWHSTKNNNINPLHVSKTHSKKYWFTCNVCEHGINVCLDALTTSGQWCSYCSSHWKPCENSACTFCFEKSFASHEKSKYWHPTKNDPIQPKDIAKYSERKFYFNCEECSHTFEKQIDRITKCNQWCQYCGTTGWKHCGKNECEWCFNRSFASSDKAKYWHLTKNETINPLYLPKNSTKEYWFKCDCGHDFSKVLNRLTQKIKGGTLSGCPYCAPNFVKHCPDKDCDFCLKRTFASHPKSKQLHPTKNGNLDPLNYGLNSTKKAWFICDDCNNIFSASFGTIAVGQWCNACRNKTEKKLKLWLERTYAQNTIEFQQTFDWCKNTDTNKYYKFDFYIPELKLIIEQDGIQHMEQVSNWGSPEKNQKKDIEKMKLLLKNGLSIIRIFQEDIFHDKNDWENNLQTAIKDIKNQRIICIRTTKQVVNDVYDKYEKVVDEELELIKNENKPSSLTLVINGPFLKKIRESTSLTLSYATDNSV